MKCSVLATHAQIGIEHPETLKEALKMNKENGNIIWVDSVAKR